MKLNLNIHLIYIKPNEIINVLDKKYVIATYYVYSYQRSHGAAQCCVVAVLPCPATGCDSYKEYKEHSLRTRRAGGGLVGQCCSNHTVTIQSPYSCHTVTIQSPWSLRSVRRVVSVTFVLKHETKKRDFAESWQGRKRKTNGMRKKISKLGEKSK